MTVIQHPKQLTFSFAKQNNLLVSQYNEQLIELSLTLNTPLNAVNEARRFLSTPVKLKEITQETFDLLLISSFDQEVGNAQQVVDDLDQNLDLAKLAEDLPEIEDLLESENDAPIIKLINALLSEAIKLQASDIHLEPFEQQLVVRVRVDGVLREMIRPQRKLAPLLVSRLKVMAKLDIAEKRIPQDGRISLKIGGHPIDVRLSTLPSKHGERLVLRLLDKQAERLDLTHLGLPTNIHEQMKQILHQSHGIILVTGPTGSGKTTTLYAGLSILNNHTRNILTVEDPIEYDIDGIGQTQVNSKTDMSFARSLRAILRQDPDVVMVGEIRDIETAQIAVQASLTGHLVLSTLHTNTAVGAISRLHDMKVEPFLFASSLLGVLAQRLVRKICPQCRQSYEATDADKKHLSIPDNESLTLWQATGCLQCNQTGYQGRTGIYELLLVDNTIKDMIHRQASETEILSYSREQSPGIRQNGYELVRQGITTLEEVLRVTAEE
ncbi:MAG: type II secretion system ATPase GspE [Gammaproteobacteria bacterium]|nr:type II secretion system ATPase GspE [Gammaproteobacteria bacterium]